MCILLCPKDPVIDQVELGSNRIVRQIKINCALLSGQVVGGTTAADIDDTTRRLV